MDTTPTLTPVALTAAINAVLETEIRFGHHTYYDHKEPINKTFSVPSVAESFAVTAVVFTASVEDDQFILSGSIAGIFSKQLLAVPLAPGSHPFKAEIDPGNTLSGTFTLS